MCLFFLSLWLYNFVWSQLFSSKCAPFICLIVLSLNYLVGFVFKLKIYLLLLLCMSTGGYVPAMVHGRGQRTTVGVGSRLPWWAMWIELRCSCLHIMCF